MPFSVAIKRVFSALLATTAGCSSSQDGRVDGPLLTSVGEADDHMAADVRGILAYDGDCLRWGESPVLWPEGTRWTGPESVLTLPSGEQVEAGAALSGRGGHLSLEGFERLFVSEVADTAERCLGRSDEIAVFNPGSEVSVVS